MFADAPASADVLEPEELGLLALAREFDRARLVRRRILNR